MKRSKPFYILGLLVICIVVIIGSVLLLSGFTKESRDRLEKQAIESVLDSVDWENFPWESFPFDEYKDFPWESMPWEKVPWDEVPENFPWEKVPPESLPWNDIPENFPWEDYPWDEVPDEFWQEFDWESVPPDFEWEKVPWENMPEDFDWDKVPLDEMPENFPWEKVPADKLPQDFDWNDMPWDSMPENYDWNAVPWEDLPEDFDWNSVPWQDLPSDFPWDRVPWENMPENFDWTQLPWDNMPENFPWDRIPWEDMPDDFWRTFPWESLPEDFPWYVLPWLLINPDYIPEGVLPDDFFSDSCEHEFATDWYVVEQPTCAKPGKRTNFCTKCKQLVTEDIPPDQSHNFDAQFICTVCGRRRLHIVSDDYTKAYDGTPVSSPHAHVVESDSATLLSGHVVNFGAATFASSMRLGKFPNAFAFSGGAVIDGDGNDVTDDYATVFEFGVLKMTTREAVIKTRDRSKTYDGRELKGSRDDVYAEGLADGDYVDLESVVFGDGITDPGKRTNEVRDFVIRNAAGEDVTNLYSFTTQFGWLRVTPAASGINLFAANAQFFPVLPRAIGKSGVYSA